MVLTCSEKRSENLRVMWSSFTHSLHFTCAIRKCIISAISIHRTHTHIPTKEGWAEYEFGIFSLPKQKRRILKKPLFKKGPNWKEFFFRENSFPIEVRATLHTQSMHYPNTVCSTSAAAHRTLGFALLGLALDMFVCGRLTAAANVSVWQNRTLLFCGLSISTKEEFN